MAFQGSLKELPLPDIIQLVSVSGKTGKFKLTRGVDEGLIYLLNGQIVHAISGPFQGEEAVYGLAIWNDGEFQFSPGEAAPEQTITKSNTNLLMEAARRSDEWKVLARKVPSIDMVPVLKAGDRREQVTLDPQEWKLVTHINGRLTIAEIAKSMQITAFEVAKVLYGLVTSELVELKKKA